MANAQTGGRFNENDEVFNSSDILHKWASEAALVFKYVNSSCKDEDKHLYYSFVWESSKTVIQSFKIITSSPLIISSLTSCPESPLSSLIFNF